MDTNLIKDKAAWAVTRLHNELYRRTGGKLAGKAGGQEFLLLTTTGRKSGQPRTTPLNYMAEGDITVLIASYGGDDRHPQWYRNLQANPAASVQIGSRTEKVRARTATAGEKAYWWPKMAGRYKGYDSYQRRTDREIPVVILEKVELAGGLA